MHKEKLYQKNRKKKSLKKIILVFLFLMVLVLSAIILQDRLKTKEGSKETNTTDIVNPNPVVYELVKPIANEVEKNVTVQEVVTVPEVITPKVEVNQVIKVEKDLKEEDNKTINEPKIKMIVVENDNLENLLDKDMNNAKFSTSIDIARYYFQRQEYNEAVIWAIRASKQNTNSVKPWIIYSKSKFRLGNKTIAIKSLEVYLKKHSSSQAKNLLNKLKNR